MTATDDCPSSVELPAVAPPVPPAGLDGVWRMRGFEAVGARTAMAAETTWAVRGAELVIRREGVEQRPPGSYGYGLLAPPAAGPGAVDFVVWHRNGRHQTLPGVYALDGGELTVRLALRGGRPAAGTPADAVIVYTFDRVG